MEMTIRAMEPSDWDQVQEIYVEGLATGQASFETTAPCWEEWDQSHCRHSRLVASHSGRAVAWAALSPVSSRKCYAGVAEVSLYIAQANRGMGIGRELLQALVETSERNSIWSLYGATFPENTDSIRLQVACGFRIVGRRERIAQHHGVWRDTLITERRSHAVGVECKQEGR